ncbi:MAG: disulfide bond formation protein DsbA [Acidimicrobiales bacterium]
MTARWVVDTVKPERDLRITWQPISLYFKNEPDPASDYHDPSLWTHKLLRVMESVRNAEGDDAVFGLYWEYGRRIHHDQDRTFRVEDSLAAVGLDSRHAEAFDDDKWDVEIRTRMDAGLDLTGQDVGTPIIAFDDRDGVRQAYFGPVITRVPPPDDALAMWDALMAMMNVEGFWELKRTRTERPDFGERP